MQGRVLRSSSPSSKRGSPSRKSSMSPSRNSPRKLAKGEEFDPEVLKLLEEEFRTKYYNAFPDNRLSFFDNLYALLKSLPFLQSRTKEELRNIGLRTKDIEVSEEGRPGTANLAKKKPLLVAAIEASLESAHIYLGKQELEKYALSLEKCSKTLVLLGVGEPVNPVLQIKFDLLKLLFPSVSESTRYQAFQSLLVRVQSQPRMEYITAVVHLLLNLSFYRIEGKISYNHIKNASSFFVRRLGLNAEVKPEIPDPDLYLLTRKLNLNWKPQKEMFEVCASCILLMELYTRAQHKEVLGDSANLARKCAFYTSCLPKVYRKMLEPTVALLLERMEAEQKIELMRDPEFGKYHGAVNRNSLAKTIHVAVNKVKEEQPSVNVRPSSSLPKQMKRNYVEEDLLLIKSAEPRSEEEIARFNLIESRIPRFPAQVDDVFMAKYSIPQEFIVGETGVHKPKKNRNSRQDLFRHNVKYDWTGNPRWMLDQTQTEQNDEMEARKNTIPSLIDDHEHQNSENDDTVSVDHELDKLVGLISKHKLDHLTIDYKSQPSQLVKRRFTINAAGPLSLKGDTSLTSRAGVNKRLNDSANLGRSSDAKNEQTHKERINLNPVPTQKEHKENGALKYRGMNSFYYKETFRKNPEFLFSQRPSDQSTRSAATLRLHRSADNKVAPEFITSIKGLAAQPEKPKPAKMNLARQGSGATLKSSVAQNTPTDGQLVGSATDLHKTRRRSLSHRVTSSKGVARTVAPSVGLLAHGIPANEPFLPSEVEELQALLTLAERRTSEDLMTKRNPTKAKRLLRKAMGFIAEYGTKANFGEREGVDLPRTADLVSPAKSRGRFEAAILNAQNSMIEKPKEPKYISSKQSSRSQLNNSLVHWGDQQNRDHKTPRQRKISSSGMADAKVYRSERVLNDSQDASIAKSVSKPRLPETMIDALVSPKLQQPSKWGTLKNHVLKKGGGDIGVSSLLTKVETQTPVLEKQGSFQASSIRMDDRRKSTYLQMGVGLKSEASNPTESASVKKSRHASSKKDSVTPQQPTSLTEEAARRKLKLEKKRQTYRDQVGKLVAAIRKVKRKRYVFVLAKLKMNWVVNRPAERTEKSCLPRIYPYTNVPQVPALKRALSQEVLSTRRKITGFTLQSDEIYATACFVSQNKKDSKMLRFEVKQKTNKSEPIEIGFRQEPGQYVIKLQLDNDKLLEGSANKSGNQYRALSQFLKGQLGGLDPAALKSVQVILPLQGFKNEQTNKKMKLLLSLLTLLVTEKYLLIQKLQGYRIVPKEGQFLDMCEIRELLQSYYEKTAKDMRSLILPEQVETFGYGYLIEDSSQPTDEAIKFLGANLKPRNRFFELNRTTQSPGQYELDESMQARRSQIKKKGLPPTIKLNRVSSVESVPEEKPEPDQDGSLALVRLGNDELPSMLVAVKAQKDKFISSPNFTLLQNQGVAGMGGSQNKPDSLIMPGSIEAPKSVQPKQGGFFKLSPGDKLLGSERMVNKPKLNLHQVIDAFDMEDNSPVPAERRRPSKASVWSKNIRDSQKLPTRILPDVRFGTNGRKTCDTGVMKEAQNQLVREDSANDQLRAALDELQIPEVGRQSACRPKIWRTVYKRCQHSRLHSPFRRSVVHQLCYLVVGEGLLQTQ